MANKQTLPNTQRFQESYINTNGAPQLPSIDYKSPLRGIAGVIEQARDFENTYTKLRYEGYQAQGTKLMSDMAHAMEDAKDPCELEDIRRNYESQLNRIGGDDIFGKSYRKSQYFTNFKNKWDLNAEQAYLNRMHAFEEIAATANAQDIANAVSESTNPDDIMGAAFSYEGSLANITHMSAEKKYNLMNGMLRTVIGNTAALNPDTADAIVDKYGEQLGEYGIDTADIRAKTDARRRALRAEARAEAAQRRQEVNEARESTLANLQAKILMNPNQADQIISEASTIDDKLFVNLSDWNRKRVGKNNESPYKQQLIDIINSEDGTPQEKARRFYEENPEALFDSVSRSALDQYLQINPKGDDTKEEDEILADAREAAKSKETWEKFAEKNFVDLASYPATRTFRDDINKKHGITTEKYPDTIINEIKSNPDFSQQDIDSMRISVQNDPLLSPAERNKIHDELDKRQNILDKREEKEEKAREKTQKEQAAAQEKVDKQNSLKALNDVKYNATTSEEVEKGIMKYRDVLDETDLGKLIDVRKQYREKEAKEHNKSLDEETKDMQQKNFYEMNKNIDTLTQEEIDYAAENHIISYPQARNLTKQLQKNRNEQIKQLEKDKIAEEKLLVAKNSLENKITDPATLTTNEAKQYAQKEMPKVYDNQYVAKLSEIKNTAFEKGDMSEDEQRKAVNDLNALNPLGKHAPEEEIAKIAKDCRTDVLKNLRTNINQWIPIRGTKPNAIELKAREEAYNEAATMAQESKRPLSTAEIKGVCDKYRPKPEDYVQSLDYVKLDAMKDSLFIKTTEKGVDAYGGETKRDYVTLSSTAKFTDLDNYIQTVQRAENLTPTERKKLSEPFYKYMSEIVKRSSKEDTIEAYAMRKVIETFNGSGVPIDEPTKLYEIYRDVINTLEQRGAERSSSTGWWIFGVTETEIDDVIAEKMKLPKGNRYGK